MWLTVLAIMGINLLELVQRKRLLTFIIECATLNKSVTKLVDDTEISSM